ncbi:hypothetical protein BSKO_04023 [Bryopsis sp. KO-2023]|nr:hypothetical protein BSKO_04023 [Bryopsis sp. KO-2023]
MTAQGIVDDTRVSKFWRLFSNNQGEIEPRLAKNKNIRGWRVPEGSDSRFWHHVRQLLHIDHKLDRALHVEEKLEIQPLGSKRWRRILWRVWIAERCDAVSEKYVMGISMDGGLRLYGLNERQADIKTDWDSDEIYFMYFRGSDGGVGSRGGG